MLSLLIYMEDDLFETNLLSRLNDVSEALDIVERIGMLNWRDVRTKCKLQEGQEYYEALFRLEFKKSSL